MSQLTYALPHESLRPFISVYYLFDCNEPHLTDGERAAIPQLRLIFDGSATMHFGNGHSMRASGACMIGPTTSAVRFEIEGPFRMLGMGILPAGWGVLTSLSAADFTDRAAPAEKICPNLETQIEAFRHVRTLDEAATLADEILAPMAGMASPELLAFTQMVDNWLASSVSPSVCDLHAQSQLSERQLTRRVNQLYGMPPKFLARKYRALRAARALVDATEDDSWFLRDAFYDQSHMIREVKMFTGVTPARLRSGEGEIARMIDQRRAFAGSTSPLITET